MSERTYNLTDAHKHYVERQQHKKKKDLSLKEFKAITYMCNKLIVEAALKGLHIRLPFKMGLLKIVKRLGNPENLKLNYKHYNATGEKLYHLNEHSDGWYGRWDWTKYGLVSNIVCYSFIPSWDNARACSKAFFEKNGYKRFSE